MVDVNKLSESEVRKLEQRLRNKASRQGLLMQKSKRRDPQAADFQRYRIVDVRTNCVIAGGHGLGWFNMGLDDVQRYFGEQ
jgi:hypothetical protein